MASTNIDSPAQEKTGLPSAIPDTHGKSKSGWLNRLGLAKETVPAASSGTSLSDAEDPKKRPEKWSLGVLNDKETDEVPGSILLLSRVSKRNEPLGLQYAPGRTSSSSLPSPFPASRGSSMPPQTPRTPATPEKKRTADGEIVLEPQPDDSLNDPLNWPTLRRDMALLSLGFYCMLGGGMTPVLAAGFNDVAKTYGVTVPRVALTTGLYMMGLGLGSVVASPTAILFGKRPVYLVAAILFILSAIWCALSPNYISLVIARIVMGFAVSPVECLPSATVAEIFFLHERAYRLGIYTLLLLGGKNLIPLVSAAIIQSLGWRWVFYIVAMVVGFSGTTLFLFVPETFWDRTPRPHKKKTTKSLDGRVSRASLFHNKHASQPTSPSIQKDAQFGLHSPTSAGGLAQRRKEKHAHFGSVDTAGQEQIPETTTAEESEKQGIAGNIDSRVAIAASNPPETVSTPDEGERSRAQPELRLDTNGPNTGYFASSDRQPDNLERGVSDHDSHSIDLHTPSTSEHPPPRYTTYYRAAPPKSFVQTLRPYSGRLNQDRWLRVAIRPFILFAYPSILWSTVVYSLSVGWLIVLSESVSTIYETRTTYNFTALQAGLVYISPFIGGVLGTAVAGKVSDLIVRWMSRRNGGIYEPEFRLVMAIPVAFCTTIGLMGYGWSAQEHDLWIVPTIFFGIISFGCSLGSTTAITFAVDSYRQYAGEALVTLNFSKNIFHGLVFSLFFNRWLQADGSRKVFLALGGIQMICLLSTIPMYIFGKRARMWTVRKNLMEKF